jgi:hypothetical protein
MHLRLALALAQLNAGHEPATGSLAWWYVRQPLEVGGWISDGAPTSDRHSVVQITEEIRASLLKACASVAHNHPRHLDLAATRLIGAAGERHDPADALIDAVIAWESMFGSGGGEVATRLSVSMALLLSRASGVSARDLAGEIKRIYNHRSKLVHGAVRPTGELHASSKRAIELGFAVLQAIHNDPAIRSLEKSQQRSDHVLLAERA